MWFPLVILALLSLVGGWVNIPGVFPRFHAFLHPVFAEAHELAGPHRELAGARIWEFSLAVLSVLVALTGIFAARLCYVRLPKLPDWFAETFPSLFIASLNKYWVDEAYHATVVKGFYSACRVAQWCDNRIIVAGLNAIAALIRHLSEIGTQLQTGYVRHYALAIVIGVVFLLIGMLL